jgi:hypothetical protein
MGFKRRLEDIKRPTREPHLLKGSGSNMVSNSVATPNSRQRPLLRRAKRPDDPHIHT